MKLQVAARGAAAACSDPDHPEHKAYSAVVAWAAVDPFIYIDPTWKHAHKFVLLFPDNVTPLTGPPEEIFADDFEMGYTVLWSSTVP